MSAVAPSPVSRPLSFSQLDHVSVIITNIERSRHFYRDLLGLKEIAKPKTFDFIALWFDLGNMHIHLLLKDQADSVSGRHFALRAVDVPAARAALQARGVKITEATVIPGADRFFVHDPDGNRIEIIQWQAPYDPAQSGMAKLDGE